MKKNNLIYPLITFLVSVFLVLPIIGTFINSMFLSYGTGIPKGFTLRFFNEILFGEKSIIPFFIRTIVIAFVPTVVISIILFLSFYVMIVYFPWIDKYINVFSKIPYGIQGVILAVSVISLYSGSSTILSNRIVLLVGSYCIVIFPYMYQGIKNSLFSIDVMPILEAAEILGAGKLYSFFCIILPSIKKGFFATFLLSFGMLLGDFVLVSIIAGSRVQTLGIYLNETMRKSGHLGSSISVMIFLLMFVISFIIQSLNREK